MDFWSESVSNSYASKIHIQFSNLSFHYERRRGENWVGTSMSVERTVNGLSFRDLQNFGRLDVIGPQPATTQTRCKSRFPSCFYSPWLNTSKMCWSNETEWAGLFSKRAKDTDEYGKENLHKTSGKLVSLRSLYSGGRERRDRLIIQSIANYSILIFFPVERWRWKKKSWKQVREENKIYYILKSCRKLCTEAKQEFCE